MAETAVLPKEETELSEPDGMAHRVRIKQLLNGGPQVALCGKKWIPRTAGAEVVDMKRCPTCEELWQMLGSMYGG